MGRKGLELVQRLNDGARWPFFEVRPQPGDGFGRTGRCDLDLPIWPVPDPTRELQRPAPLANEPSKSDALHSALNFEVETCLGANGELLTTRREWQQWPRDRSRDPAEEQ